jgi:hypothetical protein
MKKFVLPLVIVVVFVLICVFGKLSVNPISKPADMCVAPYGFAACADFTYTGLRLNWGEGDGNFIAVIDLTDQHMLWNGSGYDRQITKTYMLQSSFLSEAVYGDCNGWLGICIKHSEYSDVLIP